MRSQVSAGLLLGALLAVAGGTGCSPEASEGATNRRSGSAQIDVVCTTGMVADIARHVGGEQCKVTALMGEGVDPHLYKVSPRDVRLLDGADVILYNGLLLEGKMADLFGKLADKKPVHAVAAGLPHDDLREPEGSAGHPDPHVWFDVSLWMRCVEHVRDVFAEFDPDNAAEYGSNAKTYLAELAALHKFVTEQVATIPAQQRVLITAHDAFGYFGDAYDIEVRGIQGISTESEAGVSDINALIDYMVQRKIKAVFVESSVSEKNVKALLEGCQSRGHEVRIGGELFSDAMGADGTAAGTYTGMVRHNVGTIVGALK